MKKPACSLSDYLERYATHRMALLNIRGALCNHHPTSVTATFSLAFQCLEQISPAAADLLRICTFLHAEAIPETFVIQAGTALGPTLHALSTDPLSFDEAIRDLRRFSLLHREVETRAFGIHRLLQTVIQDNMTEEEHTLWIERLIQAMLIIFPDYREILRQPFGALSHYQPYLSHALVCATHIKTWHIFSEAASDFLYRVGCFCQLWGNPAQALSLLQQARLIAEKLFGTMHVKTAFYLYSLALIYANLMQLDDSLTYFQQALAIREQLLGPAHPEVADSLWGIASILMQKGLYGQALPFAQQALTIKEQTLGLDHYEVAWVLNITGCIHMYQGNYAQAEALLTRGLSIYQETVGSTHGFVASCLNNLGYLSFLQKQYDKAVLFYQQGLQIRENVLGPQHYSTAETRDRLGYLSFLQKQYQKAELFPLLSHLPPPSSVGAIRLDRFSPNFDRAEHFGFLNVKPYPAYRYIYPFEPENLFNLAYFFTYRYRDGQDTASYAQPVIKGVFEWQRCHAQSELFSLDKETHLLIFDRRPIALKPITILSGVERILYLACDGMRSLHQLQQKAREYARREFSRQEIESTLQPLVDLRLLLYEDDFYLGLALLRKPD